MNKLPKTFCITLKETPNRTKEFFKTAQKAGIHATLFDGIFGKRMGLVSKLPNTLESPDPNVFMSEGAIGCYLSHYILWNVLLYLPEEEFFIVEDDVLFADDFQNKFDSFYSKLPNDWELVYVGWIPFGLSPSKIMVEEGISILQPSATHAYMVKKSFLKQAIDTLQPCYSPLDLMMISKLLPKVKYYVFDPPLVEQKSYLNIKEPLWNSLVYDWKNDMYDCKKKLLNSFSLNDGWFDIERNNDDVWCWSKPNFSLLIPENLTQLKLIVTTPIKNVVTLIGSEKIVVPINHGINEINIPCQNVKIIKGQLETEFIPQKMEQFSNDTRSLGICLKKIIAIIDSNEIEIDINTI